MQLKGSNDHPALIDGDDGVTVSYERLNELIDQRARCLGLGEYSTSGRNRREVVFLSFLPTIDAVVDYLTARATGATTVLLDPALSTEALADLAMRYQPTLILRPPVAPSGYGAVTSCVDAFRPLVPTAPLEVDTDVSLLLSASSGTESPKRVQLTAGNLVHNAAAISNALALTPDERGLASLPLFQSLGLSVLNSHLEAGATTVLTSLSPLQAGYWGLMNRHRVTSMPAVAKSFSMFRRVGMLEMALPHLRYIWQTGGPSPQTAVQDFHRYLTTSDRKMLRLHGQTEATGLMSIVESPDMVEDSHLIGDPLPDGSFRIDSPGVDGVGQIIYSGPNVMLGYANSRADIGRRSLWGELPTGEFGHLDDQGRMIVAGRFSADRVNLRPDAEDRLVAGDRLVPGDREVAGVGPG